MNRNTQKLKSNLTRRKDSVLEDKTVTEDTDCDLIDASSQKAYPFAVVLRLRVLQIVCGISALVMGSVAFIEEKGKLNLGLGIPAGGATILAAAASIHTSRGFGGYRPSTRMPGTLRFLGPSIRIALPLAVLWGIACSFQTALMVQTTITLSRVTHIEQAVENHVEENSTDLVVLASVELGLALLTLSAVIIVLRIDCKYDPD